VTIDWSNILPPKNSSFCVDFPKVRAFELETEEEDTAYVTKGLPREGW